MKVHYVDAESISIIFSSLVIKADSLNKAFTSIDAFARKFDLNCTTNGKIVVIHEMNSHHPYMSDFVETHLEPLGIKYGIDYTFVSEELFYGVEGRPSDTYEGKELFDTVHISWLNSKLTKKGCYVSLATVEDKFAYLFSLSLNELVDSWNNQVGNIGWTSSRASFLVKLKEAFRAKGVDVEGLDFKNYKILRGTELVDVRIDENFSNNIDNIN